MKQGFSLVELSIVLVILGLLTGGILTGQNLIRAAELRKVVTQFTTYQTATQTFRDKYFALPGDMTNATDFWGAPGGNIANCPATAGTGTETCNGNGNGQLSDASGASRYGERYMFWQQLANAGLIEGTYTGRAGSSNSTQHLIGVNVPAGALSSSGWSAYYRTGGDPNHFNRDYGNTLYIGAATATAGPYNPIFTPAEAWNIDKKLDDGKPARGKLSPLIRTGNCTDASDADDLDADYQLTYESAACFLNMLHLF
jgi:prepilin-type N-terminal cleavage/methylation domain-containing protein